MAEPYNARWGLMATGGIAEKFAKDLLIDPALRGAGDISHTINAVASSTSKERAEKFIDDLKLPSSCAAYGSYEEIVRDPNVDIIYVASPHSHHFQNSMLALENGKHVLCEKAFTVNAAQAKILVETGKKGLFLMEAVWTRFLPISVGVTETIQRGEIGEVIRVMADTVTEGDLAKDWGAGHRMVNPDLAGGALLYLGIYSLTWAFMVLYHTLPPVDRVQPSISSQIIKYEGTGADESTSILLEFPQSTPTKKFKSHAIATASIRASCRPYDPAKTNHPTIRIQGTTGEIEVYGNPYQPHHYELIHKDGAVGAKCNATYPGGGRGMYWEADEVARCLRDGELESKIMPLSESVVIMEVMDEARRQGGLRYPDKIESTQYPLQI